jgi:hypothetical protein
MPDAVARAFVVRCILAEGPAHHRGSNFVLLGLLDEVLKRLEPAGVPDAGRALDVPMRLPPHLEKVSGEKAYPLKLPAAAIERLSQGDARAFEAMVDCVVDGPPQHALANVAMVTLLEEILRRLDARGEVERG